MRWWPTRARRRSTPRPPEDLLVTEEMLRRSVEDVLVVRDRQLRGGIFVFRGILTMQPGRALDVLIERFRPIGYTPFLREEAGAVSVQAWPLAETRSEEHTSELQSHHDLVCRLLLEKKNNT